MRHRGLVLLVGLMVAIGTTGCATPAPTATPGASVGGARSSTLGASRSSVPTSAGASSGGSGSADTSSGTSGSDTGSDSGSGPGSGSGSGSGSTGTGRTSTTARGPIHYVRTTIYRGSAKPDDLVLDANGRLLFSDYTNGTISRLEQNGMATVLYRDLQGPEGLVLLADGTLVVAEEKTNRILAFAPGATTPHLLRTMPGRPTLVTCHQGTDGIAWDASTGTLVIPDAPNGVVYRMSTDGSQLSTIAAGFVHPVGADVDAQGVVYIADECGGGIWRVARGGQRNLVATVGMPDDVALDHQGGIVVTDVHLVNHSVTRFALDGSTRAVLARTGLAEPQGLLIDPRGHIFVADDRANLIIELTPVG
ncbi:SMP-30/gluconolactonase/LRE family protein [Intrasporangium oryzae]|nr:SMP-30/gluconolactonase/LRE family protein [Intrasporangium oryzae]